jgi:hypothetical protein
MPTPLAQLNADLTKAIEEFRRQKVPVEALHLLWCAKDAVSNAAKVIRGAV